MLTAHPIPGFQPFFLRDATLWLRACVQTQTSSCGLQMFCARSKQITCVAPAPPPRFLLCLRWHVLPSPRCFSSEAHAQIPPRWEMAAELEPLMAEWLGAERAEDTRGSEGPQGRWERGFGSL